YGARFEVRAWEGYAQNKNLGNSLARFSYILSLDADEALSEELQASILSVKSQLTGVYRFARLTYYGLKAIRHGGWYPDLKSRLFPKAGSQWEGDYVHESLAFSEGANITTLQGDLLHYSFRDPEDHRQRIERYARLAADKMYAAGQAPIIFRKWVSPAWRWLRMYLLKGGWRDGKAGWQIAVGSARALWLRQVYLQQRYRRGQSALEPQKPRIMFVNLSKEWGGGEKWFYTVGKSLRERGFAVSWFTYTGSALAQRLDREALPHYSATLRFLRLLLPGQIRQIKQHLQDFQPDIVMLNASHELKTVGWVARRVGIEKVILRRGVSYPLSGNRLNRWFVKQVPTHFLANSRATFEAFAKVFPRVERIPHLTLNNGIDPSPWQANHANRESFRIGMSARLSHEKGIDRAIEGIKLLREQGVEAELYVFGEGPLRPELESLIEGYGLQASVKLRGFVDDVAAALNECSIFLFTPRYGEGTSLALIEAMLLELPCVVMDSPAMSEVVVDGVTGYLVPDGDVERLVDRISSLLSDRSLQLRMGQAGRKRALERFTLDRLVSDLAEWLRA
ncbi:MAG: glycosyltransferase, partial [Bacteroidota bacterium]